MHQLKSIYISPFKDSYSLPIHTCLPIIASNGDYKEPSWPTWSRYPSRGLDVFSFITRRNSSLDVSQFVTSSTEESQRRLRFVVDVWIMYGICHDASCTCQGELGQLYEYVYTLLIHWLTTTNKKQAQHHVTFLMVTIWIQFPLRWQRSNITL